ncbi:hypothetical protein THTE_0342 [Thermogutta terrifontis]|uniref:DUF1795 domain-containing protein n=1 Tax=Thermogutta terrifontis TaxID=1331910 RepID=A0A286RAE2_9BACT|nr:hypothetical protein [Thermogutta terrifontis]ASV72944.1 hypothetical protein THTE_0342 [Thermogutta terrifontis]
MPAEYNNRGIRFQYPENWRVEEDDLWTGRHSVTVYSPEGAFWSVSVHPRDTDPHKLADAAVQAMRQEYDTLEVESSPVTIGNRQLIGYEMNFFHLDLICTAQVHCVRTEQGTYVFFAQGWDREFEKYAAVFQAMTTSCLSYVKKLSYWD